jgi:hypothetical protein
MKKPEHKRVYVKVWLLYHANRGKEIRRRCQIRPLPLDSKMWDMFWPTKWDTRCRADFLDDAEFDYSLD